MSKMATGPSEDQAPPDWNTWQHAKREALWKVAALACDIDPSRFKQAGPIVEADPDSLLPSVPQDLRDLLDQAKSAIGAGVLRLAKKDSHSLIDSEVEMTDFATWLRAIGHKPPAEYPWTPRTLEPGIYQWPWGSYQTRELGVLARAVDKFWKNYDPSDASTAPKSEDVMDWLQKHGISERKAEAIASLLRADDLPTGRRR